MLGLPVPADAQALTPAWLSLSLGCVDAVEVERIGEDFGLSGTTFRVDVSLADGGSTRAVVRLAPAGPTLREIAFFTHCAPETPLPLPGFLGGGVDGAVDRGVVLLEYLSDTRQGDVLAGCTREEGLTLARMLGRLHAVWWRADHPAVSALRDLPDAPLPTIREGRLDAFLERHGQSLSPAVRRLVETLPTRLERSGRELGSGPVTLIHRDYHLDNVLFPSSGEPFVIDWQGAAVGPPAVDVARFLVEGMTSEQRRRFGQAALTEYARQLEAAGVPPDPAIASRIVRALELLLAGTVNWLGSPAPDPPGSRKEALGRNILRNISEALGDRDDPGRL